MVLIGDTGISCFIFRLKHMTFISFYFKAFETKKKQTEEVKLIPEGRNNKII